MKRIWKQIAYVAADTVEEATAIITKAVGTLEYCRPAVLQWDSVDLHFVEQDEINAETEAMEEKARVLMLPINRAIAATPFIHQNIPRPWSGHH